MGPGDSHPVALGESLPKNSTNTRKPEMRNGDFLHTMDHASPETIPNNLSGWANRLLLLFKLDGKEFPMIHTINY